MSNKYFATFKEYKIFSIRSKVTLISIEKTPFKNNLYLVV